MQLVCELTNEGGLVTCEVTGRSLCRIHVRRIDSSNDPNLRVQKNVAVPLDEPYVHFTGAKLTCTELAGLAIFVKEQLSKMDPKVHPFEKKAA